MLILKTFLQSAAKTEPSPVQHICIESRQEIYSACAKINCLACVPQPSNFIDVKDALTFHRICFDKNYANSQ